MMNGVETGGKVMLIKELLKQQNVSICEISRKVNASYNYVSHIKSCLRKNLPTHLHQKKFRSRNPEKRNKERMENYDIGAKYDYCSRMSYSKREDELILKFKGTDMELAKLIGRSVKAIQVRRTKIKKWFALIVENILEPATQLQDIAL